LKSLPEGPWPATLETLFLQETKLGALPASLAKCDLKRLNLTGVSCPDALAKELEGLVLSKPGAIFWDKTGKQSRT